MKLLAAVENSLKTTTASLCLSEGGREEERDGGKGERERRERETDSHPPVHSANACQQLCRARLKAEPGFTWVSHKHG